MTEIKPQPEPGTVISPVVLQLKRLTRDLQGRVQDFRTLIAQLVQEPGGLDPAALQTLADRITRMRQDLLTSGEITVASRAAMARSDPAELTALRDQLLAYLAALDCARRNGESAPAATQPSSVIPSAQPTFNRPE